MFTTWMQSQICGITSKRFSKRANVESLKTKISDTFASWNKFNMITTRFKIGYKAVFCLNTRGIINSEQCLSD